MEAHPPVPPFTTAEAAQLKVRLAEDLWNTRDPGAVAGAYTADTVWRNRTEILRGCAEVAAFLRRKWKAEHEYRLVKELWGYHDNRMAVRFAYEWQSFSGDWFRSFGSELWEFELDGLMSRRIASINDLAIRETDRRLLWPLGRRPDDQPGLTDLML